MKKFFLFCAIVMIAGFALQSWIGKSGKSLASAASQPSLDRKAADLAVKQMDVSLAEAKAAVSRGQFTQAAALARGVATQLTPFLANYGKAEFRDGLTLDAWRDKRLTTAAIEMAGALPLALQNTGAVLDLEGLKDLGNISGFGPLTQAVAAARAKMPVQFGTRVAVLIEVRGMPGEFREEFLALLAKRAGPSPKSLLVFGADIEARKLPRIAGAAFLQCVFEGPTYSMQHEALPVRLTSRLTVRLQPDANLVALSNWRQTLEFTHEEKLATTYLFRDRTSHRSSPTPVAPDGRPLTKPDANGHEAFDGTPEEFGIAWNRYFWSRLAPQFEKLPPVFN